MLQKITKVKGFGVLDNLKSDASLKPFSQFNLIYGWNGSGKTTLGRLLRCLETKKNHVEYGDADFSIDSTDGKVESKSYDHRFDIRVFNQDFISDNLNLFNATTKPIIFISKEKVDEKKELDKQKELAKQIIENITNQTKTLGELEDEVDGFHKTAGKSIKDFLLGTIYANVTYNKKTSLEIWTDLLKKNESLEAFVLSNDDLVTDKNYTLLNSKKETINRESFPAAIDMEKIAAMQAEVHQLLTIPLSAKVIARLQNTPEVAAWVGAGVPLHREKENCEFCGSVLSKERVSALEAHFNEAYLSLINDINQTIEKLSKGERTSLRNDTHLLYEHLQQEYNNAVDRTNEKLNQVNGILESWCQELLKRKRNPFDTLKGVQKDLSDFETFNTELSLLLSTIDKHNNASENHDKLAQNAKKKIEYHFVSDLAIQEKLTDIEGAIRQQQEAIKALDAQLITIKERIQQLENDLKNDSLAIEELNLNLHKFLGRTDIVLERQEEGGYQLKRNGHIARNLSEGEKTAISLIFFFSKIRENDAKIADQIIILDDPISSFDSNHLFNASSFIKASTEKIKQVFVLTHNFWFFKQVRDWMKKKNDSKKGIEKSNIYVVRNGAIANATPTLLNYHSEYHYVFSTVLDYQRQNNFDDSLCFSIANCIRRVLEAFTSFKTPDNGGFNGALQLGEKKGLTAHQRERIFYFVNKYSHLDRIESFDNTVETLFEEAKNVVSDVLWLIKKVDEEHYNSMLRVCGADDHSTTAVS